MGSIISNNTWKPVDLPLGCKTIGCKGVLKRKLKLGGTIEKFKARLVSKGFKQKEDVKDVDFFYTYSPVTKVTSIRLLIIIAAIHNLMVHQMNVKTTFFNGDLKEEIYMDQLEGFIMPSNEHEVCKLLKFLLGSYFYVIGITYEKMYFTCTWINSSRSKMIVTSGYIEDMKITQELLKKAQFVGPDTCRPIGIY